MQYKERTFNINRISDFYQLFKQTTRACKLLYLSETIRKGNVLKINKNSNGAFNRPTFTIYEESKNPAYKVSKGIPIPGQRGASTPQNYPFFQMEIGDSFSVPKSEEKAIRNAISRVHNKNKNLQFTTRKMGPVGRAKLPHYRVWRIK